MTLVEDRTAFVEQLGVPIIDKRAEKLRRRVAEARVHALEVLAEIRLASDALSDLAALGTNEAARDARALRLRLRTLERRARRKRERLKALEERLRECDARERRTVTYRLHSAAHYVDLSDEQYARASAAQRTSPTLMLKRGRRQWWWYRDHFWWDDAHLASSQVATRILESQVDSSLERHLFDEAREVALRGAVGPIAGARISDDVRRTVWRRDAGRCVDCGSAGDVRFEVVGGLAAEPSADDLELRCRTCSALRAQFGPGAHYT